MFYFGLSLNHQNMNFLEIQLPCHKTNSTNVFKYGQFLRTFLCVCVYVWGHMSTHIILVLFETLNIATV